MRRASSTADVTPTAATAGGPPKWSTASRRRTALVAVGAVALLAGCASAKDQNTSSAVNGTASGGGVIAGGQSVIAGWDCRDACDWSGATRDRDAIDAAVRARSGSAKSQTDASGESRSGRATNVDDNAGFTAYLDYRAAFATSHLEVLPHPVEGRKLITVVDEQGRPVANALIEVKGSGLTLANLRTHADGRAVFDQPEPAGARYVYQAVVSKGAATTQTTVTGDAGEVRVVLPGAIGGPPPNLDVMLVVDATGSMQDELARLQDRIGAVVDRLRTLPGHPAVRAGLTVYRDRGDAYTSRTFSLTPDLDAFAAAVRDVRADGGGDTFEDVQSGLAAARNRAGWGGDDTAKVLILLGDAGPHLYPDQVSDTYVVTGEHAAEAGIAITAVGAPGLDEQGEYVFRQLAQMTLGRYVYLAGGASGSVVPAAGAPTPTAAYDHLSLDDLVVAVAAAAVAGPS